MKIYKIKVNGKIYEVEVESVEERPGSIQKEEKPVFVQKEEKPLSSSAPAVSGKGTSVKAPMQGTIISVKVNVGDHVNKGDVVVVLEAMKLENEIVSPTTGIVQQILVNKGESVNNQQDLVVVGWKIAL